MEKSLIDILAQSDLFKNIAKTTIENLLINTNYTIKQYTRNDVFALSHDKVNYLMIVLEGGLIARLVSDSGKYVQIDKIETGRIIAPAMLFATDNTFPVNVIPDTDTKVFFMRKDTFLSMMNENELLLTNFIQIISDINKFLSKKIHSLTLKTIRGKLAEYILQLSSAQNSDSVELNLSRQELADKFAVSRQALSRSLSELEDKGLIQVKAKKIIIENKGKLMDEK